MQQVRLTETRSDVDGELTVCLATVGASYQASHCIDATVEEEGEHELVFLHGTAEAAPRRSTKQIASSGSHGQVAAERHRIKWHERTKRRPCYAITQQLPQHHCDIMLQGTPCISLIAPSRHGFRPRRRCNPALRLRAEAHDFSFD